jgi:hypothetical protein
VTAAQRKRRATPRAEESPEAEAAVDVAADAERNFFAMDVVSHTGTFRVLLNSIRVANGAVVDDFKTWANVVLITRGRANCAIWYAGETDGSLAKTSVRTGPRRQTMPVSESRVSQSPATLCPQVTNGNEDAAYNYIRHSKPIPLNDSALTDLASSKLMVRPQRGQKLPNFVLTPIFRSTSTAAAHGTTTRTRSWAGL